MQRCLFALLCLVACEGGVSGTNPDARTTNDSPGTDAAPPTPSGCVTDVSAGNHDYTCEGLAVNAQIPPACLAPGCGLILQLHGDTGNGALMDAHTNLRALGQTNGYIVLSPTGPLFGQGYPGSTWSTAQDAKLVALTQSFANVFRVDSKRIHATGFSRGGFVAWRMLCDHADLFASVAPSAAGNGNGEVTCFNNGRAPARQADILFLLGRTDASVPFATMTAILDGAVNNYGASNKTTVAGNAQYTHSRWTAPSGAVIETFEHSYETDSSGPWGNARGHCFPGSTFDPFAPQYAVPCKGPNAFTWGEEVIKFFKAHPKR